MTDSISVDPHGLAKVGRQSREVAAAMPTEIVRIQGPSDEAAAALRGWRTQEALTRCTQAWTDCLRALAAEVDANGANMIATADNYAAADSSVHSSMSYAGAVGGGR
ncbi:type VII secretion target [Saccharothrix sp. ST-888]|uniref:type VII secretion target n=1 Tax=Saccharothrix sp. ST-888 TaxID=1427391 RepID=UPI00061F1871|nr:type VII secretion target [Saccharothrix sp. ST-888]KJK58147.1 hypothetical protein UK12_12130 [Saccharothrix sp. ST-888]